jgi:hypothetical protein
VTTLSPPRVGADAPTDLDELRTSARGWHGVQLGVLGFIGLCGALKGSGSSNDPTWLQQLAGLLVLVALALACVATVLVATAAWPVYGSARAAMSPEEEVHRTGRRLRAGIVLTFVAVLVLAVATSSSWWPSSGGKGDLVELSTAGGSVCGTLLESEAGTVAVEASGQRFVVPVGEVVSLLPTASCPSG